MTLTHRRILTTLFLGLFPVALWMLRNVLVIGHTSAMHRAGESLMLDKLGAPLTFYGGLLGIAGVIVVVGAVGYALVIRTRYVASLLLITLGHLAAVYLPSLVTQINALDGRLLFTVTVFAAIVVALSLERMWGYGKNDSKATY